MVKRNSCFEFGFEFHIFFVGFGFEYKFSICRVGIQISFSIVGFGSKIFEIRSKSDPLAFLRGLNSTFGSHALANYSKNMC